MSIPADTIEVQPFTGESQTCRVRLTCGHFSVPVSVGSSWFDFPDDPINCCECNEERQMDLGLQAYLNTHP
jgi:hypothetical protein